MRCGARCGGVWGFQRGWHGQIGVKTARSGCLVFDIEVDDLHLWVRPAAPRENAASYEQLKCEISIFYTQIDWFGVTYSNLNYYHLSHCKTILLWFRLVFFYGAFAQTKMPCACNVLLLSFLSVNSHALVGLINAKIPTRLLLVQYVLALKDSALNDIES